jgi:hypothetical protein
MKNSFVHDELNDVNNYVFKDMWAVGTKIIPESWTILSTMIVTLTVGKYSQQYRAYIYIYIYIHTYIHTYTVIY